VFFGETAINLDAKGRLAIPTRYRELIDEHCAGRLVLSYSAFDSGSLWMLPEQDWKRMRDNVMALSNYEPAHRALQRRTVGSAAPVEPDGSGRIQLPQTLRQVATLDKHVVFMGMGNRFEIWNEDTLNQQRADELGSLNQPASEEMARLVF
jgi:MraZ protein